MKQRTIRFEGEEFEGGLERVTVGTRIEIRRGSETIMVYDSSDATARNFAVASLLELGIKGKHVAKLCGISEALVTLLKKRYRENGYEALVHQGRGHPEKKLTGSRLDKAKECRRQGMTIEEIGKKFRVSPATAGRAVRGIARGGKDQLQPPLPGIGGAGTSESKTTRARQTLTKPSTRPDDEDGPSELSRSSRPSSSSSKEPQELQPGARLPSGPAWHPCRYAGTLLICAALNLMGVSRALVRANVERPETSVYDSRQVLTSWMAAWVAGYPSLESMHERDARALGVVLGLERCPSVRTLHRAQAQMVSVFDPICLQTELSRMILERGRYLQVFGVDGHVKQYNGKEPIDKGWDTKTRMVVKALSDVMVHDERGWTILSDQVGAGDKLSAHVLSIGRRLRSLLGPSEVIVLVFDRGGFSFDVLNAMDAEGFGYIVYVPSSVQFPKLDSVAPEQNGVSETKWSHPSLQHSARLLVRRDGKQLIPAVTNLPDSVDADEAFTMLREHRGGQENSIKATRAFAYLDRLVDRGGARRAPDDRLIDNPNRRELLDERTKLRKKLEVLTHFASTNDPQKLGELFTTELEVAVLTKKLDGLEAKVPRVELEPDAERAWLKTANRELLGPLKLTLDNARRWLRKQLGLALCPTDNDYDRSADTRTLMSLLRAPGKVRFSDDVVEVILQLPLPPTAHERLANALNELNRRELLFTDRVRRIRFALEARPTRSTLPSVHPEDFAA